MAYSTSFSCTTETSISLFVENKTLFQCASRGTEAVELHGVLGNGVCVGGRDESALGWSNGDRPAQSIGESGALLSSFLTSLLESLVEEGMGQFVYC